MANDGNRQSHMPLRGAANAGLVGKLAWRNLWRNRLRTSIMLACMVFGLMGVVSMMGFMTGMYANMIDNAISWQTSHIQISQRAYVDEADINHQVINPEPIVDALKQLPSLHAYSKRVVIDGMVASARASRGVKIVGVNPQHEADISPIERHIIDGAWLDDSARKPMVISTKTAKRLNARVGSKLIITFTNASKDVTGAAFRVAGTFQSPSSDFDDGHV